MEPTTSKKEWYQIFRIPKRKGGFRIIEAPNEELKKDQRKILSSIMKMYAPSKYAFGGIKHRNITDAASPHCHHRFKLKMDISDYFHHVRGENVLKALLKNKAMNKEVAEHITYLCTNADGVLPMGAPTSTFLANVASQRMHNLLGRIAGKLGATFTCYVDDLIFSADSMDSLVRCYNKAKKICERCGFEIKPGKTVFMRNKQEVLGLCAVNSLDHPRLSRKRRYRVKAMLFNFEKDLDNGNMDISKLNQLRGEVGFAIMAKDQWAGRFLGALVRITEKVRRTNKNAV